MRLGVVGSPELASGVSRRVDSVAEVTSIVGWLGSKRIGVEIRARGSATAFRVSPATAAMWGSPRARSTMAK